MEQTEDTLVYAFNTPDNGWKKRYGYKSDVLVKISDRVNTAIVLLCEVAESALLCYENPDQLFQVVNPVTDQIISVIIDAVINSKESKIAPVNPRDTIIIVHVPYISRLDALSPDFDLFRAHFVGGCYNVERISSAVKNAFSIAFEFAIKNRAYARHDWSHPTFIAVEVI